MYREIVRGECNTCSHMAVALLANRDGSRVRMTFLRRFAFHRQLSSLEQFPSALNVYIFTRYNTHNRKRVFNELEDDATCPVVGERKKKKKIGLWIMFNVVAFASNLTFFFIE